MHFFLIPLCLEIENDRLRHIRLHERVNDLPDPNYATLKYFMGHLHKLVMLPPHPLKQRLTVTLQDSPMQL